MSELTINIDAPIEVVWQHIADIESHVSWMDDAKSIELVSGSPNSVKARYLCKTSVGPFSTDDTMEVINYKAPEEMEMRHIGAVTGTGTFRLKRNSNNSTTFIWEENLTFPWYMGGPIGKVIGMKLLHSIWKKNLISLKKEIESK